MATLHSNRYGKFRVRFLKVIRHAGGRHDVCEIEADVMLQGDLDASYLSDDNRSIVPTDTVKNTLQVLAHDHLEACRSSFARVVGDHFLDTYAHIQGVEIELRERAWKRLGDHPHSFTHEANGAPFSRANFRRGIPETLSSGIRDHLLLKSTGSGFAGYNVCEFTTLPPTGDRILSTRLTAEWTFSDPNADFPACDAAVLAAIHDVFANTHSPSVQRTLFQMGEAALAAATPVGSIRLTLPNVHFLNLDLSKLGRPGQTGIFLPTDEPHGQIEATVTRD